MWIHTGTYINEDLGALLIDAGMTAASKTVASSTKSLSFTKPLDWSPSSDVQPTMTQSDASEVAAAAEGATRGALPVENVAAAPRFATSNASFFD